MRFPYRIFFSVIAGALSIFVSCNKETKVPAPVDPIESTVAVSGTTQVTSTTSGSVTNTNTPSTTLPASNYSGCCLTQNVIIVVVDGARYSETWGDYSRQNIPNLYKMYSRGVLLGNFRNMGTTNTDSGHDAIVTGNYENLENTGQQLPQYPSMFQAFLASSGKSADKAWIVTSKDKLEILANCKQEGWANQYKPRTDCGIRGLWSGYRSDEITLNNAKDVISTYHPNLMLINFKDPDVYGHGNNWADYVKAIKITDAYIKDLYDVIQNDPIYKDRTTLIVTNDHGRHSDGNLDGFINHGDACDGCRHIQFLGIGPDFQQGYPSDRAYEQTDISQTVAKLLNFKMPYSKGKVISEIFRQ
jgi:hypothetical protein